MSIPARSRGSALARARDSYAARHILLPAQKFIHTESSGGVVLLAAAALALIWANSPWSGTYEAVWRAEASVHIGPIWLSHSLREWINDALMVVFFFVVGLEVKREFVHGELSEWRRGALPIAAALGGMLVPAALYTSVNLGQATVHGWGIPMATDIAFAIGVLALLGDRVPSSLRTFLLALAIVDDIGAILVIAVFYTERISFASIGIAVVLVFFMIGMRRIGIRRFAYYAPVALMFWFAVLESGIHATIAGVILGLLTPVGAALRGDRYAETAGPLVQELAIAEDEGDGEQGEAILGEIEELTRNTEAPADRMLRLLHPWSSQVVLPIFALANAGVVLAPSTVRAAIVAPETYGIVLGLGLGKLAGILLFSYLAVRLGVAVQVAGAGWAQMAGLGFLGGIGFTVSLFITDLAFTDARNVANAKTGILLASALTGLIGFIVLRTTRKLPRSSSAC